MCDVYTIQGCVCCVMYTVYTIQGACVLSDVYCIHYSEGVCAV